MKRKLSVLLLTLAMMVSLIPFTASADAGTDAEAYIMYADGSWTSQFWNDGSENPVVATKAKITGSGTYKVSLDFTGTDAGSASGLSFAALGIKNGETLFPNHCITITDIKLNGASIDFTKGYTSSDDKIETRMNIMNEWVTELPKDARSADGDTEDANWITVDKALFEGVKTMEVSFTYDIPEAHAYIMYADASWTYQYWGEPVDSGVVATDAKVKEEGQYTVALDFTGTPDGAATDIAFTALGIKGGEISHPGWFIKIDSIKINGAAVNVGKGYTSSDDKIETRMNIMNEWVTELPKDARSHDGVVDDANWVIVPKDAFASVKTMEVTFTYIYGDKPEPESDEVEIDVDAALAADYNAYFGIQTENYIFRNAWYEATYGIESDNWTYLTGWDAENNQVNYGGEFTDSAIDGNGTFTVGVKLGEMGLAPDASLRMLFISTNIPSALYDQGLITISDVKTVIDSAKGQTFFAVNTEGDYIQIDILNEYNADVGVESIPYTMPTDQITISFKIDGLSKDSAGGAVIDTPDSSEAPASSVADSEADEADGLSPGIIIAIVGGAVLVIGVVVIVIVSKKRR